MLRHHKNICLFLSCRNNINRYSIVIYMQLYSFWMNIPSFVKCSITLIMSHLCGYNAYLENYDTRPVLYGTITFFTVTDVWRKYNISTLIIIYCTKCAKYTFTALFDSTIFMNYTTEISTILLAFLIHKAITNTVKS